MRWDIFVVRNEGLPVTELGAIPLLRGEELLRHCFSLHRGGEKLFAIECSLRTRELSSPTRPLVLSENECQAAQFVLRALAPTGRNGSELSLTMTAGRSEVARDNGQAWRDATGLKRKK
jgi:hypothetical protein